MKKRVFLFVILGLVIGFASITTTLIITGVVGIGTNNDDYQVFFEEVLLNGVESDDAEILENGKKISFSTNKLINKGDTATVTYKVRNYSTQYDANVTINCNEVSNKFLTYSHVFAGETLPLPLNSTIEIKAQQYKEGTITAVLSTPYTGDDDVEVNITCTLIATAAERTDVPELSYASASEVLFTPQDENWNVSTVEEALNDLRSRLK